MELSLLRRNGRGQSHSYGVLPPIRLADGTRSKHIRDEMVALVVSLARVTLPLLAEEWE